jgi:hypothetical protein
MADRSWTNPENGLIRLKSTVDAPTLLEVFDRDGGVIVEYVPAGGHRSHAGCGQSKGRHFVGLTSPVQSRQIPRYTIRFTELGLIDGAFFEMLENPILAAVADAVLAPMCGSLAEHRPDDDRRAWRTRSISAP